MNTRRKRVGWRLLVLLWIWAGTVFVVVDLFLDAPGLHRVRPRAGLYQAMRMTAHELVGEALEQGVEDPTNVKRGGRGGPERRIHVGADAATVLGRLAHDRPTAWAPELAALRGNVPPELLGKYAEAAATAAAEMAAAGGAPSDEARALAAAAIDAQAQALLTSTPDWRSARITIEKIAWAFPDWSKSFEAELSAVRYAVVQGLAAPASPDALADAVELAATAGDAHVAGVCLRLLPREPAHPRTREDALVQDHAVRAVTRWGNDQDRIALDAWLSRALSGERDLARYRELARQIDDLRSSPPEPPTPP